MTVANLIFMHKLHLSLLIVASVFAVGCRYGIRSGNENAYRTLPVTRGAIRAVVNSTGTVQPVLSVQVGAFVSGPIQKVLVDFNDRVKKGQLLAQIDPRIYKAAVAHEQAALLHEQADLIRVKALLKRAQLNEKRGLTLHPAKAISDSDFEQCVADRESLEAQIDVSAAAIKECEATLATARTNLEFTNILSPVDGVVIDRKVDPGQTVASQFQTPVLFVVAPDLEKKIYVYASVDEADIGQIRDAQARKEPVTFTVDAYPRDEFTGQINQVRLNPTTVQNVVTYTVVVESGNAGLKLLPGMTANLTFQIERHSHVLAVPNAALRFVPKPAEVRGEDRAVLDTLANEAGQSLLAAARSSHRYVWIQAGPELRAVKITTGLSDRNNTEVVSGDLSEGQPLVVGPAAKN
jgi:HlyD family secretion protein